MTVDEARRELASCRTLWWFTGGHALELFARRSWRAHDDLDIGVRRRDAVDVLSRLAGRGWETMVAAAGVLSPWDGGELHADLQQNNVWCRRPGGPWRIDVTVGEGDGEQWVYRRDLAITRPWAEAVHEVDGTLFLAPELQLLFKSKDVRPKDTIDAERVVPLLDGGGLALLRAQLPAGHPWFDLVRQHVRESTADDVNDVLDILRTAGIEVWVDGGWAVDALLGEETRPHADLDLAIPRPSFEPALRALTEHEFRIVRNDGRHNQVVADHNGRTVDIHAFDLTMVTVGVDGLHRCSGDGLPYEAHGFDGIGRIAGKPVACISPASLVRYHTGYTIDADDWHDVRLLCTRFNLPIPPDYEPFQRP